MANYITLAIKRRFDELELDGVVSADTRRNAIKEELQYYVLSFIYHHPKYKEWTMYGGSALRICYGLNRMSVDLDFETSMFTGDEYLRELKDEIERYFIKSYQTDESILSFKINKNRGLTLKFSFGPEFPRGYSSDKVHVKIDLNNFSPKSIVRERKPVNRNQLSFIIKTYKIETLMASKIVAVFDRSKRGVDKAIYEEKGRDIYDLLWYMNKHLSPDLSYLAEKGIKVSDNRELFDRLNVKIERVSDTNLRQDLSPLFSDQRYIENWLLHWRESYKALQASY